jgi:RNA polymerase sigma-70 factor (ECF subfamily)
MFTPRCRLSKAMVTYAARTVLSKTVEPPPFDIPPPLCHHKDHRRRQLGYAYLRELFHPPPRPTLKNTVSADDQRLIAACLEGEQAAFGELVRRYQDRLFHTVFRLVNNADDAADVVQEAFLNAYQSLENFKGESLFFTWLYRIAINTAISWRRKQRPLVSIEGSRNGDGAIDPVDASEFSQPGHALEQAEEERRVQNALQRLSLEHRTVLVLKDIEGRKYDDMAEVLGVPIGTIRSRLHRARTELREVLEQEEERQRTRVGPSEAGE